VSTAVERNCADRVAAKGLLKTVAELIKPELANLPSDRSRQIFWQLLCEAAAKRSNLKVLDQIELGLMEDLARGKETRLIVPGSDIGDIDDAMLLVELILELADNIPEAGEDFAMGVCDTTQNIAKTIEEKGFVTEKQMEALENMQTGLLKWVER